MGILSDLFQPWKRPIEQLRGEQKQMKDEILQAVAEEKAQVAGKLAEQEARIQALEDTIRNGGVITAEDLAEIKNAIHAIYEPEPEQPAE